MMQADPAPFQGHGSGVDAIVTSPSARPGRRDGRAHNEMRAMSLTHDSLRHADGSARLQVGATDVLVAIYGPLDGPVTKQDAEHVHVHIAYRRRDASSSTPSSSLTNSSAVGMPSSSSSSASSSPSDAEEATTTRNIRLLVVDALLTQLFPRKAIVVAVQVLCDRGAVVATAFNAAVAALVNAGVPMRVFPVAACVSVTAGALTVDPLLIEEREAEGTVTAVFDTLLSDDKAFLSVCTQGICQNQNVFSAAMHTCRQLATKTRAFMTLSLEQRAGRNFMWNTSN